MENRLADLGAGGGPEFPEMRRSWTWGRCNRLPLCRRGSILGTPILHISKPTKRKNFDACSKIAQCHENDVASTFFSLISHDTFSSFHTSDPQKVPFILYSTHGAMVLQKQ
jgi:hypothetical protein